ncbi:MAG: NAD(+) synthase [Firmicutes bacterium]|nr:NAD(+) synthase [Bacillota bacterium]
MTIAIAQLPVKPGAPADNTETMLSFIAQARTAGAELIVFPELAVSGLLLGSLLQNAAFLRECEDCGRRVAAAAQGIAVIFGCPVQQGGAVTNGVFLARTGELTPLHPAVGESYIAGAYNCFAPAAPARTFTLELAAGRRRIGLTLGDWRGRELPFAADDVDLLIDLANKPLRPDDPIVPAALAGRPLLSVNSFGLQNSGKSCYLMGGGSFYQDGQGRLTARAPQLTGGLFFWNSRGGEQATALAGDKLLGEALVCGVREFMTSIRSSRAVIGISGGIDSALAACIYAKALGPDNVYLISMPSRFNSSQTRNLAEGMARGLHTNYAVMPIQKGVDDLMAAFAEYPVQTGDGRREVLPFSDSVKENVQARERCRILAAAAAAVGGVFTCNGNKAELSVGYATFYGDLAGAFAAQADLWKHQVYRAASYFQTLYPDAPLDAIAAIRPSAELSDKQDVTKGLGDPLIYAYHDHLLAYWMEAGADLYDVLRHYRQGDLEQAIGCRAGLVAENFADTPAFITDLEYWWRMYLGTGIAKRIQSPPLLALSAHPYGEEKPQSQGAVYHSADYRRLKESLLRA